MSWNTRAFTMHTRRNFLRAMGIGASGALLAPTISRLVAEANGMPASQRFIFVVEGNGMYGFRRLDRSDHDVPVITDLHADFATTVPSSGQAFEPFKERLLAINGLDNKQGSGLGASHRAHSYALSTVPYTTGNGPGGISIDQLLVQGVGDQDIFPCVLLGASTRPTGITPTNSALGPNNPLPVQFDPDAAFSELFGAASPDPLYRAAFNERKLVLESLAQDVRKVQGQLAGEERWKFDRFMHSIEVFQRRQMALEQARGQLEQCIPSHLSMRSVFPNRAPEFADVTELDVGDRATLMADLLVHAVICGLTHVGVLSVGSVVEIFGQFLHWGFGPRHTTGHGGFGAGPALAASSNKISQLIVDMATKLDAVPEGDGTMLDNTTFVFINDNGNQHHSKYDNFPLFILGDIGGRLQTGGRLIEYPKRGKPGSRGLPELWKTFLHAIGQPHEDFATESAVRHDGLLDEILA